MVATKQIDELLTGSLAGIDEEIDPEEVAKEMAEGTNG